MSSGNNSVDRRDFLKSVGAASVALGAGKALAATSGGKTAGRVIGANDRIGVGVIGYGGRGNYVASQFTSYAEKNNACQIVAVCDVWEKRRREGAEKYNTKGYTDYRELLAQPGVDAVVVCHARSLARARSRWRPWTRARTCTWKSPCATPSKKPGSCEHGEGNQARSAGRLRRPLRPISGGRPRRPSPTA